MPVGGRVAVDRRGQFMIGKFLPTILTATSSSLLIADRPDQKEEEGRRLRLASNREKIVLARLSTFFLLSFLVASRPRKEKEEKDRLDVSRSVNLKIDTS